MCCSCTATCTIQALSKEARAAEDAAKKAEEERKKAEDDEMVLTEELVVPRGNGVDNNTIVKVCAQHTGGGGKQKVWCDRKW